MAISTWAATTGDWDDAKFSQPWDGPCNNSRCWSGNYINHSIPIASEGSIAYPAKGDTVLAGKRSNCFF